MRLAIVVVTSALFACTMPTEAEVDEPTPAVVDNPVTIVVPELNATGDNPPYRVVRSRPE